VKTKYVGTPMPVNHHVLTKREREDVAGCHLTVAQNDFANDLKWEIGLVLATQQQSPFSSPF
jgi:hypothetical protein